VESLTVFIPRMDGIEEQFRAMDLTLTPTIAQKAESRPIADEQRVDHSRYFQCQRFETSS
jgi:hypothetical protein